MKSIFFTLALLLLTFSSCITINRTEARKSDDGYTSISEQDRNFITAFDIVNVGDTSIEKNKFQYINANEVRSICKKYDNIFIIVWATWCPVCHDLFANDRINSLVDSLEKGGVRTILVSQNFNISYAQKLLLKWNYKHVSYIIDPIKYGTDELRKQDLFLSELTDKTFSNEGSVPNSILLNKEGKMLFNKRGKKISATEVLTYKQKQ